MQKKILVIGSVWPEPNSSAAGSRMMQLITCFLNEGYYVVFASATDDSEYRYPLEDIGVGIKKIELNDSKFDAYIENAKPEIVLFDRFMTEEQFGWRVEKNSPDSVRILDTEDLHCLRKARQKAFKENRAFEKNDLFSEIAKREIASIFRSDVSLMISSVEMKILAEVFNVPPQLLCYVPFLLEPVSEERKKELPSFEDRSHFVTIGSFRHDPNWDSVLYLKKEIWPILRKKIPEAELHIYGSYPSQKAMQLHNPKENFFIRGWAKDAHIVVQNAKVMLAPLRFGAGLKGKFIDAMLNGTPSVTTKIGAEAMHDSHEWSGAVVDSVEELVAGALELYVDKKLWEKSQENGYELIKSCYDVYSFTTVLFENIEKIEYDVKAHRNSNFIGCMLLFHTMRSTEFMSRWIEEKNKK
jgi:O-antigen biosynthesis protein